MIKPPANSTAISTVLDFIDGNLGIFNTKQEQTDALENLISEQTIQLSEPYYAPYQPTGSKLHTILKSTVTRADARRPEYRDLNKDQTISQLFKIGRAVLEPRFLHLLEDSEPQDGKLASASSNDKSQVDNSSRKQHGQISSQALSAAASSFGRAEAAANEHTDTSQAGADTNANEEENDPETGSAQDHRKSAFLTVPLESSLKLLDRAIMSTASIIFPDDVADCLAQPDLDPSEELQALYTLVLANNKLAWKHVAADLLGKGVLEGRLFFQSLVWAFVRTSILSRKALFGEVGGLLDKTDAPGRYVNTVLHSRFGHDIDDVRQGIFTAQLDDHQFRHELQEHAADLSHDLMLILAGHIEQLNKAELQSDWCKDLVNGLLHVCKAALLLQVRLEGSSRLWKIVVFKNGKTISGPSAKIDSKFPGSHVAFTIMPGLSTEDLTGTPKHSSALVAMGGEEA